MYQRQKCTLRTLVSSISLQGACGFPGHRGVKKLSGCRQCLFSVLSLAISSAPFEIRSALLYSNMGSIVSFSLVPKYVTLNDPEWLFFCVKFYFRACRSRTFFARNSKTISLKEIKYKHYKNKDPHCQRHTCSLGTLVSGNVRFMRILSRVL